MRSDLTFVRSPTPRERHPLLDAELDRMLEALCRARSIAERDARQAKLRAWLRKKWDDAHRIEDREVTKEYQDEVPR